MAALEPYIDAHSHIWTPDVAHYPLAAGFTVADMKPPSFTAEELLAHLPAGRGRAGQPDPDELLRVRQPLHARHDQAVPRPVRRHGDRRPAGGRARAGDAGAGAEGRACLPHPAAVQQAAAGPLARAGRLRGDVRHRRADRPGPELPDRPRRLPRGRPDVPPVPRDHGHHRPPRPDRRPTGRSATPTSRPSAPWRSTPSSSSRSGRSTPWARRRPRISTWPR